MPRTTPRTKFNFKSTWSICYFLMTGLCFGQGATTLQPDPGPVAFIQNSLLEATAASENYKTLLEVVKATDLEDLLDQSGPFTLFAPSDVAFDGLIGETVEDLLHPMNREELKALLSYHLVAGKVSASKILKALCRGEGTATLTTVQGDIITATMKGLDIILSDSFGNTATIVVADAMQRNGIIHEIDAVIRPETANAD